MVKNTSLSNAMSENIIYDLARAKSEAPIKNIYNINQTININHLTLRHIHLTFEGKLF